MFGERGEDDTISDFQKSVFCVCPPGHSQWTSRPFKVRYAYGLAAGDSLPKYD